MDFTYDNKNKGSTCNFIYPSKRGHLVEGTLSPGWRGLCALMIYQAIPAGNRTCSLEDAIMLGRLTLKSQTKNPKDGFNGMIWNNGPGCRLSG